MNNLITLSLLGASLFSLGVFIYTYKNPNLTKTQFLKNIIVLIGLYMGLGMVNLLEAISNHTPLLIMKNLI